MPLLATLPQMVSQEPLEPMGVAVAEAEVGEVMNILCMAAVLVRSMVELVVAAVVVAVVEVAV